MPDQTAEAVLAERTELIIRKLDSLSTLHGMAQRFMSELLQTKSLSPVLTQIIESDPALTATILSLLGRRGIGFGRRSPSARRAVAKLPADAVRSALLSAKVLEPLNNGVAYDRTAPRRELIRHSLAVACCAEQMAQAVLWPVDSQTAYTAGLLHDLGKLAVDEAMPKSFARIIEQAESDRCSCVAVEQRYLGVDHGTLGRRIATKWQLPDEIANAIWLHHSDIEMLSQVMPEMHLARVIQAADSIARQSGIGQSGSYDTPASIEQMAERLAVQPEQLEQIRGELAAKVEQKANLLGLDLPHAATAYYESLHTAAAQLAGDNSNLSGENRRLQTASSHLKFLTDFLFNINAAMLPIEAAEDFAVRWQRFYQTGRVCLYLIRPDTSDTLDAVLVESLGRSRTLCLKAPDDRPSLPAAISEKFDIIEAQGQADWLFEQLDVPFDVSQARLLPVLANGRAVGVIVFELRYPADTELFRENFGTAASAAGCVLDMLSACAGGQLLAEKFVQLLAGLKASQPKPTTPPPASETSTRPAVDSLLSALAELAGGAAHELNNPLSVISGRAQLLTERETDEAKRRMLIQIQDNTDQISAIIDDLIVFAEPRQPRPAPTDVKQMLAGAVDFAGQKTGADYINAQIKVAGEVKEALVDSAQMVSAIANIICNCLESYAEGTGPVQISAEPAGTGGFVEIKVSDLGCGMDAETAQKATVPFFSGRAAGRKRGMGLAHARRLIELNNGSLKIESQPGRGTTVTITLRRR